MNKKIIAIDIFIIIMLTIINILPGSPLRYNIDIPNLIINILALAYAIKSIKNQEYIKINRVDILIIILSFSTFIPLISNSYLRLGDTVEYILRYMSALNIYFITKKYISNEKNKVEIISKVIIFMSIISIFIGIDMMTANVFDKLYDFLKVPILDKESVGRMNSLFKYANTFCVYISIGLFFTLGNFIKECNKYKKGIYLCCIFMQIFAIIMTYSRLCWIIMTILLILYIILIKEKRKDILKALIKSGINAIIYYCLFTWLENAIYIWGLLILQNIIQYIIYLNAGKINFKINKKQLFIMGFIILALFSIAYILKPNELMLFNSENSKKTYIKQNIEIEENTEYTFTFNIDAYSNTKNNFRILIKQWNVDGEELIKDIIRFDNFNGDKKMEIKTINNAKSLSLNIECKNPDKNSKLIIHSVHLNNENIKIYYKFIPINLVNRIEKLKINDSSLRLRLKYIEQSIKIARKKLLFGLGGNAWKYSKKDINALTGIAEHSYPMQVLIQNGIIAFLAYIFLIIDLCIIIYKNLKRKEKDIRIISFIFALVVVLLHNILDFDMYFQSILIDMYMFIAILNNQENKFNVKIKNIFLYIYGIILIISLYFNLGEVIALHMHDNKNKDYYQQLNEVNNKIILSPYRYEFYEEKINCLYKIKYKGLSNQGMNTEEQIISSSRFITDIEKYKQPYKYNDIILNKIDLMTEANQDEILREIKEIWENDIGANIEYIYNGIISRLRKVLDNEKTEEFIKDLKLEKIQYEFDKKEDIIE